jgi:DNA polymerase-3 subunit delta'
MLNVNAANAILKNLEEPPPKTLFLLVSHAPGRLLPTIRSRCRRLDLKPLGSEQVADLARRFGEVPASELEAVAKLAGGSVGKAIQLGNADGLALYEAMFRATESLPSLDMVSVHKLGDLVARKRSGTDETDSFPVLAGLICDWLAGLVLAGARGGEGPEVIAGERQLRARLLAMAPLDRWFEVWEKVGELLRSADGINLNRKQVIIESFSMIAGAVSGRTA